MKAYAAMGLLHAAIDAALHLRSERKLTADQVERIEIDLPKAAYGHGGWRAVRPLAPIGAQMNVAYTVAVALIDGDVLIDQFTEERINRDDVWNLIDRTETRHEQAYDRLPADERLTTRLRLTLKDGGVREAVVRHPRGTGDRLLTNTEIVDKYRSLTHSVVPRGRQDAIENAVLGLEALDDISQLTALLTPAVRPALD
ncbi:hypothetical protein AB0F92_22675 [Kitasatospora aureofaciens]|uniref:hypothetical protein n=1 Tax=Kitasatospora aureofaciens TaxID=1894 RepID=UPI0033C06C6E